MTRARHSTGAALALGLLVASAASAEPLAQLTPLVGAPTEDVIAEEDTLLDVAYRHGLGFDAIARLNPEVDPWVPEPGTRVRLPTEVVLPVAPRRGLVINIPEMRLFDFTEGEVPQVFSVAIGDPADPTPAGGFRIGNKREDPVWNVPISIQKKRLALPARVPPGDANPLGDRWMTLGVTSYGIHGTNNRWSIGRMATHGCIRLYNDDMRDVYLRTPSGTPVEIVYQVVKLGERDGQVYIEAHPDLYERDPGVATRALVQLLLLGLQGVVDADTIDRELAAQTIAEARGVPVRIGRVPEPAGRGEAE